MLCCLTIHVLITTLTGIFLMGLFYFWLHPFLLKTWAVLLGQMLVIHTNPEGLHSKGNCRNLKHNSYSSKSVTLTSSVHLHNGWFLWAQGSSAMANEGCMSLRLEHLHFHRNKRAFGQLLPCFVLIANQDTCCYSALSSLLSICVGTQGQEVTFLFCILFVFPSFHCSYLSQSVCLKSVIQLSPQLHCHFQIW